MTEDMYHLLQVILQGRSKEEILDGLAIHGRGI